MLFGCYGLRCVCFDGRLRTGLLCLFVYCYVDGVFAVGCVCLFGFLVCLFIWVCCGGLCWLVFVYLLGICFCLGIGCWWLLVLIG